MVRVLVVYGTTEGHTAKIAGALAETLQRTGATVEVRPAGEPPPPPPDGYSGVIVAASVHAGQYQRSVRRWVRTHAETLARMPSAFVSVSLGVLQDDPNVQRELQEIVGRFAATTGWTPAVTKFVAGALPYTRYGWLQRLVMKRIVGKAGGDTDTSRDYEYTDWNDLKRFAADFVRGLTPLAMAPGAPRA